MMENYNVIDLLNDFVEIDPVISEIMQEIEKTGVLQGTKI